MTEQRRLAAILVADVVGYSKLIGSDESGTLTHLRSLRTEIIEPQIAKNAGRLFKAVGDGFLVEFASAVQAVAAAQGIQQANTGGTLQLRIGIHVGDVVVQGDDLMGDGVNIAARIEGLADAGGIAISRQVRDQVRDKMDVGLIDKGVVELKNILRPVGVFTVSGAKAPVQANVLALPDKPSIAVLPFQNMSGDPEQEYFADGIVEDIITALSRFRALFVIARNSSFTYKGKTVDIKQVGRELGVRYVLEGSVRKASGRVRITGQLIDATNGRHLWADRFDGALDDIFDLQDEVSGRVVAAVAPQVEQAEIDRARQHPAKSFDAYDCYLRGLALHHEFSRQGLDDGLRLARRAIDLDSNFSAAYGLAASCHGWRQMLGFIEDAEAEQAAVRGLAAKVFLIGRDDAYALGATAFALVRVCRDHQMGMDFADRALEANSNLPDALYSRAEANLYQGNHAIAIEQTRKALRLNPRDPSTLAAEHLMAFSHLFEGRYSDAIVWAKRALSRVSDDVAALRAAACAYVLSGQLEEAARCAARHRELLPDYRINEKGSLYRRAQDRERFYGGLRLAGFPE